MEKHSMAKILQALGSVMLDVEGLSLNENDTRRLLDQSVGGVILFARNFQSREQVMNLISEIRALREPELLIAVDQEGGRVQRFKEGFTLLPPMAVFGALYDQAGEDKTSVLAFAAGVAQLMAEELIECGVDISFAPVLDLGLHDQTVIGNRAFHDQPEKIIALAGVFISGMHTAGMAATGKHFPGHGHVLADSHLETPVDTRSLDEIRADDMRPFIELKEQLAAVMTAHIDFPAVDHALPTFSRRWLQDILRDEVGFKGLIFSDDLIMHGACVAGNITDRANQAIAAGCDMVLVCNDHDAMDELLAAGTYLASPQSHHRFIQMKARPGRSIANAEKNRLKKQLQALAV